MPPNAPAPMAGLETIMLIDALVVPDPLAVVGGDGYLHLGVMPKRSEAKAVRSPVSMFLAPLAAGPAVPLGCFLGEVLSIASMQQRMFGPLYLTGAQLSPPQIEALAALDLLRLYMPLTEPTRFRKLCITKAIGCGPSRMIRPAIETLRFIAEPYEVSDCISILEPATQWTFNRTNQADLLAWLRAHSFAPLDLNAMRLGANHLGLIDLIAALAACRIVLIDDPLQAAMLGFCDPGTLVLELGIEGRQNCAVATCARLFSLRWRLITSPAPRHPNMHNPPEGERHLWGTEINIEALDGASMR